MGHRDRELSKWREREMGIRDRQSAVCYGLGMPKGLLNALKRMYAGNDAYYNYDGQLQWLFLVISGVLQGCPLSGSLFLLCFDSLLSLFKA